MPTSSFFLSLASLHTASYVLALRRFLLSQTIDLGFVKGLFGLRFVSLGAETYGFPCRSGSIGFLSSTVSPLLIFAIPFVCKTVQNYRYLHQSKTKASASIFLPFSLAYMYAYIPTFRRFRYSME
ncbi:hypothetical protein ACLB2K_023497 [Fragaria x ananassa]